MTLPMRRVLLLLSLLLCSQPLAAQAQSAKLPALGADAGQVSVSGLSSGAFMAVQYDVVFSAGVMGVGVVAGGPYDCGQLASMYDCMQGSPSGAASYQKAVENGQKGLIDPVDHLRTQRVYLFSGKDDLVVSRGAVDATRDFYRAAGAPAANLRYVTDVPAGHAFLTASDFGNACFANQPPFVDHCPTDGAASTRYDQPKEILSQIYGPLQPKAATLSAAPAAFDQTEFIKDFDRTGMAKTGFVYVPAACAQGGGCRVHVVFHGCAQTADVVGDAVYGRVGYNEWADANRIIVLYPQVGLTAPATCWDWWGEATWLWGSYPYTGRAFATHDGRQLAAVNAMVQRLTAQP